MSAADPSEPHDVWTTVKRGLRLRCPRCGEGRLLAGYLKPATSCAACAEDLSELRADDGPAWATIILVGHLVSPSFLLFATPNETHRLIGFVFVLTLMLSMTFALLPRMKGLFMALVWRNRPGPAEPETPAP